MSVTELLALLGNFWWRLILFPGGLAAFGLIWLLAAAARRARAGAVVPPEPFLPPHLATLALACPWLALAWLPVPPFEPPGRQADLVALLALFEVPRFLLLAAALRHPNADIYAAGLRRTVLLLCAAPGLMLALLALAVPGGSLEADALVRLPDPAAEATWQALHWIGASGLILLLPALLEIGPFAVAHTTQPIVYLGYGLRRLGVLLIAAWPLASLLAGKDGLSNAPWWLLLVAVALALLSGVLGGLAARLTFRQRTEVLLGLGGLLLMVHAVAHAVVLAGR